MNVNERLQALTKLGLCFRCLEKGHHSRECTSKFKCTNCQNTNHHRLLCLKSQSKGVHSNEKSPNAKSSTNTDSHSQNYSYSYCHPTGLKAVYTT